MADSNNDKINNGEAKTAPSSTAEVSAPEAKGAEAEEKAEASHESAGHEDEGETAAPAAAKKAHDEPHAAPAAAKEAHKEPHVAHAHAPAHGAAHAHKPNVKEYMVIFAVLAVLTVLEVGVAKMPGISRKLIGVALVGLALTKAAIVGLYYMHLKHETRVLKLTVALPMAAPTIYAIVLISEAAWRLTRW